MQTLAVNFSKETSDRNYNIYLGDNIISSLPKLIEVKKYSKIAVICDVNLIGNWLPVLKESLAASNVEIHVFTVAAGEESKDVRTTEDLWTSFNRAGLDRKSLVINLGGGAICDLGGFAASTYMRGIDFVHIATTLLSQVDASIGGKVAINLNSVKNLIGTFTQPRAVFIDLKTLSTLPKREYKSGFAEIIKHGLIADAAYFESLSSRQFQTIDPEFMLATISTSCQIKASVVSADETETGLRKILNFGHTIGHAIESLSHQKGKALLHGEAISLGIVAEGRISFLCGMISAEEFEKIEKVLTDYELPIRLSEKYNDDEILALTKTDKKNTAGQTRWVLLEKIGKAGYDLSVGEKKVKDALRYLRNE